MTTVNEENLVTCQQLDQMAMMAMKILGFLYFWPSNSSRKRNLGIGREEKVGLRWCSQERKKKKKNKGRGRGTLGRRRKKK